MRVKAFRLPPSLPAFRAGKLNVHAAVRRCLYSEGEDNLSITNRLFTSHLFHYRSCQFLQTEVINPGTAHTVIRRNEILISCKIVYCTSYKDFFFPSSQTHFPSFWMGKFTSAQPALETKQFGILYFQLFIFVAMPRIPRVFCKSKYKPTAEF